MSGDTAGRCDGPVGVSAALYARRGRAPRHQNQRFDYDEFNEQFKQQFGYSL